MPSPPTPAPPSTAVSAAPAVPPAAAAPRTRIVVLGGGFGGLWAARHLERLFARRPDVEVILVCRDNFFLMTPLLFEAFSGTLELRHCSLPVRDFLRRARFVEATVDGIDLERRVVHAAAPEGQGYDIPYDQLVLALGARTNLRLVAGSEIAFTFKTLADAMVLRDHMIERFERADVEADAERKRRLLTFVVIGGGLVGVELFGEMTAFADEIVRYYRRVRRDEVRFFLFQATDRILPEVPEKLARYAARVLGKRQGVVIRTDTAVQSVEPGRVHLAGETIEAGTIVLSAGIVPSPLTAALPVPRERRGHVLVEGTLRSAEHPEVWALGDCAEVPDPERQALPLPRPARHARGEGAGPKPPRRDARQAAPAVRLQDDGDHGLARPRPRAGRGARRAALRLPRLVGAPHLLPDPDAALEPARAHPHGLDARPLLPPRHRQARPRERARPAGAQSPLRRRAAPALGSKAAA